ncbi:arsenate reductase (glutaredoxin) [Moraxella osloensis]|uniref:Arsenate reductase n=1 Tax=Faucicola osloensis TaxID=34062 RepID=A0A378Q7G1_FAUOS|nr:MULTISPECIES: arsenate reductase (glutaredoxin) [Moraxella]VWX30830.1 arsenate reductase [Moraxellaceae bacterium 17A]AME01167.1 arsenate reductase [Moraxella osloensis]OBX57123.1 arsenate reductase (glutaredoxin) [Moraxella osloensis]QPT43100.1 arsenate reductase (glutaredoxin) [Moraxella osloensis]STY96740.1 Arsenate reductase [Moraxella osloensis]
MQNITIYHNPNCGTSRNTLALIKHQGIEPSVIEYLDNPPDETTLRDLITKMGITPRQLLRVNVPPYAEHRLDNLSLTDDDLIQAMLADPLLINRPIVVSDKGVKLCRPSEVVLDLIDTPLTKTFIKEDGEKIEPTI